MFRVYNPNKPVPLTLLEMPWPRAEEASDPEGGIHLVVAVADLSDPDNVDLAIPLLAFTEDGVDLNETAKEELKLAGYKINESLFTDQRLKIKGEKIAEV